MNLSKGIIFISVISGCADVWGDGTSASETRTMSAFDAIVADTSLDVVVTRGDVASVAITTDANLLRRISTDVVGGTLRIRDTEAISTQVPSLITIVVPDLVAADANGSGAMSVSGFTEPSMHLGNSGSGHLTASIHADALDVLADGSGSTTLDGAASLLTMSLSGSGSVESRAFVGRGDSKLDLSGSGSMHAELDDGTASLNLSGSGSIHWSGSSKVISEVRSGSGSIVHEPQ